VAGRRIAVPLLVIVGEEEEQLADAGDVWRAWADDVTAARVPGGHFVPEEAPDEVTDALLAFLRG
jgi:haloacetate dehalogenase